MSTLEAAADSSEPTPDSPSSSRLLPASQIPVVAFRHIVMLPLLLRQFQHTPPRDTDSLLQPWIDQLTQVRSPAPASPPTWVDRSAGVEEDRNTGRKVKTPVRAEVAYEEIVYFHPFFRDFLFTDGTSLKSERPARVLTRTDVTAVEVELGNWQPAGRRFRLTVDRVELHLLKPLVAILVVEVSQPQRLGEPADGSKTSQPATLAELQDFQDQFRRLYPPFWWDETVGGGPGLCLRQLQWFCGAMPVQLAPNGLHLSTPREQFDKFTREGAEPPLFEHWRWFFGDQIFPLRWQDPREKPVKDGQGEGGGAGDGGGFDPHAPQFRIQQLLDERMPVMSYFGVPNPHQVSLGDRDRLTFIDASGTDPYPYQKEFLDARRARHCYDRFAHYGTRYFCSGYGFVMLGKAGKGFFSDKLQSHFQHHYLHMGLIAHYQKAALLYFADEMSTAIKWLAQLPNGREFTSGEFRERIERIQNRFLKFRSRSFFPDVTNQLQGHELFELWFNSLETQKLFDSVDSLCERLTDVLAERESRRLNQLASTLLPVGLGVSVFSGLVGVRELFNPSKWFPERGLSGLDWGLVVVTLLSVLAWFATRKWIDSQGVGNRWRRTSSGE